jgi:hypothetical protein
MGNTPPSPRYFRVGGVTYDVARGPLDSGKFCISTTLGGFRRMLYFDPGSSFATVLAKIKSCWSDVLDEPGCECRYTLVFSCGYGKQLNELHTQDDYHYVKYCTMVAMWQMANGKMDLDVPYRLGGCFTIEMEYVKKE